jgi:hypothetical protein
LKEFATVEDTTAGSWEANGILSVSSLTASSNKLRSTTSLTFVFSIPDNTVMDKSNYAAISLPSYWGTSPGFFDQSAQLTASISQTVVGDAERVIFKLPTVAYSVGEVVVKLNTGTDEPVMLKKNEYTLVVKNVPTPENPASVPGSFILSIGTQVKGGKGWSSAQFFNFPQPAFATETGKTLLSFDTSNLKVNAGMFSDDVCVMPAEGKFKFDLSVEVAGGVELLPAKLGAKQGDAKVCG